MVIVNLEDAGEVYERAGEMLRAKGYDTDSITEADYERAEKAGSEELTLLRWYDAMHEWLEEEDEYDKPAVQEYWEQRRLQRQKNLRQSND